MKISFGSTPEEGAFQRIGFPESGSCSIRQPPNEPRAFRSMVCVGVYWLLPVTLKSSVRSIRGGAYAPSLPSCFPDLRGLGLGPDRYIHHYWPCNGLLGRRGAEHL